MSNDPNKETPEVPVLEHESDGIKELDNLLPRWWVWLFWMCNVFALGYMLYFHVLHLGDLQAAAYKKEAAAGDALKTAALERFESNLASMEPSTDPAVLHQGQQIYSTYCAPCHRQDGGGLVGPNLTDTYWMHGESYGETLKIIVVGVPERGMLSWRGVLKPQEIQAVASYIYTLRGSNPPNPKPPENQAPVQTGPSEFE